MLSPPLCCDMILHKSSPSSHLLYLFLAFSSLRTVASAFSGVHWLFNTNSSTLTLKTEPSSAQLNSFLGGFNLESTLLSSGCLGNDSPRAKRLSAGSFREAELCTNGEVSKGRAVSCLWIKSRALPPTNSRNISPPRSSSDRTSNTAYALQSTVPPPHHHLPRPPWTFGSPRTEPS